MQAVGSLLKKMKANILNYEFVKFILFFCIFSIITIPFIMFYGPFSNVKKTSIGTIMSTMRFQFIAKAFFSFIRKN